MLAKIVVNMSFLDREITDAPFKLIASYTTTVGEVVKRLKELQHEIRNNSQLGERLRNDTENVLKERGIDDFFIRALAAEIRGDVEPSGECNRGIISCIAFSF